VPLTIRPMTDSDIDEVAAVHVRTWQVAYAGIVPAETLDGLDPAVFAARRRDRPRLPDEVTFVAVEDGAIIGFAGVGPRRDGDGGELYAIYVDPAHWRGGAGVRLFEAGAGHLREHGFPAMTLWVFEENPGARAFYEMMGLRPDGAREYYTPRGSTARLPEIRYEMRL
jgi:GNAT superfamily N-acetyltransferase